MLTRIGKRPQATGDLVDALLECHDRIREFSALAYRAGHDLELAERDLVDACTRARRYFHEALPLHVADEEESILPRLRGLDPALDAELVAMHDEHAAHEPLVSSLQQALSVGAAAPLDAVNRSLIATRASALQRAFDEHLAREEHAIFPALRARLDTAMQARIRSEMRERRA